LVWGSDNRAERAQYKGHSYHPIFGDVLLNLESSKLEIVQIIQSVVQTAFSTIWIDSENPLYTMIAIYGM